LEFERALQQFLNALEIAEHTKIDHLIGMSHMNIGICYEELKDYEKAAIHLKFSIKVFEKSEHSFLTKALFALTHVYAKKDNIDLALKYFMKGKGEAENKNDKEYIEKFKILEGLYFSHGEYELINEAFSYLADRKMFADMENFATEIGDYFYQTGELKLSNEFYRMSIEARRKIKRGEIINENQPNSIGSNGVE